MTNTEKFVKIALWALMIMFIFLYWIGGVCLAVAMFSLIVSNGVNQYFAATCAFVCFIQLECIWHITKIRALTWLTQKAVQ